MADIDLVQRIEQLAAGVSRQEFVEESAVTGAIATLRMELGAVRAEVGSLRAELGATRAGVEAATGRMAGSVSSAHAEATELLRRHDELTARLGAVVDRTEEMAKSITTLTRSIYGPGGRTDTDLAQAIAHRLAPMLGDLPTAGGEDLATTLRTALTDLGGAVDRSLSSVASSVHDISAARDADRRVLSDGLAELRASVESLTTMIEALLPGDISARLSALEQATGGVRDLHAEEFTALRTDLADALEEIRDDVAARTGESAELLRTAVRDLGARMEAATGELGELASRVRDIGGPRLGNPGSHAAGSGLPGAGGFGSWSLGGVGGPPASSRVADVAAATRSTGRRPAKAKRVRNGVPPAQPATGAAGGLVQPPGTEPTTAGGEPAATGPAGTAGFGPSAAEAATGPGEAAVGTSPGEAAAASGSGAPEEAPQPERSEPPTE